MSIYVISNDINIKNNLFKVGRTKDTNTEIVTKYQRYLSGARLLLWYPSTLDNYVEDEREILRFFDLNRNYTPNGSKNEWLSVSFEQLKTKMDEYFGQNGENFEEQKYRNHSIFKCTYCEKQFTRKSYMTKHLDICKKIDAVRLTTQMELIQGQYEKQIEKLENQMLEQREQYEKQMLDQREQYEKQIEKLEKQIQKLENQIFEIIKQPTNINTHNMTKTTNNNQKTLNMINQLAPYDLTTERVQEILNDYTHILEKVFGNGPNGIADFIVEKILFDSESQKPKLVATDRSRGVFKYKDSDGNVHIDHKLKKTTDILQKPLLQANDQVFTEIYERQDRELDNTLRNTFNENSDLLNCINKHKLGAQLSRRLENEIEVLPGLE